MSFNDPSLWTKKTLLLSLMDPSISFLASSIKSNNGKVQSRLPSIWIKTNEFVAFVDSYKRMPRPPFENMYRYMFFWSAMVDRFPIQTMSSVMQRSEILSPTIFF